MQVPRRGAGEERSELRVDLRGLLDEPSGDQVGDVSWRFRNGIGAVGTYGSSESIFARSSEPPSAVDFVNVSA